MFSWARRCLVATNKWISAYWCFIMGGLLWELFTSLRSWVSGEWTALWLLHPTYKPIYRAIYRFGDGGEASEFLLIFARSKLNSFLSMNPFWLSSIASIMPSNNASGASSLRTSRIVSRILSQLSLPSLFMSRSAKVSHCAMVAHQSLRQYRKMRSIALAWQQHWHWLRRRM